jgi:uncharacterized protein YegP (UPF0339 family)
VRPAEAIYGGSGMRFEYGQDSGGQWHWRLKTVNERVVAVSGEAYDDEDDCTDAILIVKRARDARLEKVERF